jgi:hypothetical protein
MSLREQAARRAFVYGVPAVALYGDLHERSLGPAVRRQQRPITPLRRTGGLPTGLEALSGAGAPVSEAYSAWIDLRGGPVIARLCASDGPASATFLDLYAEQVADLRSLPGGDEDALVLAGPCWEPVPGTPGIRVHRCRTDLCWAVGQGVGAASARSPVTGSPLRVEPLRELASTLPFATPVPPVDVRRPPTCAFLVALDWLLPLMPTPAGEEELRAELETIGVGCGRASLAEALAEDQVDGELTEGLRRGYRDVRRRVQGDVPDGPPIAADPHLLRAVRVLAVLDPPVRSARALVHGGRRRGPGTRTACGTSSSGGSSRC